MGTKDGFRMPPNSIPEEVVLRRFYSGNPIRNKSHFPIVFRRISMRVFTLCFFVLLVAGSAFAQGTDQGIRDTLFIESVTWTYTSEADSISPAISLYGWSDNGPASMSLALKCSWESSGYDGTRWNVLSTGVSDVDSLFYVHSWTHDPGTPGTVKTHNKAVLDPDYKAPINQSGYNGILIGELDLTNTPILPLSARKKIGELRLRYIGGPSNGTPNTTVIEIDSNFFPPAGTYKWTVPGSEGYGPYLTGGVITFQNLLTDAEDVVDPIVPQSFELGQNYPNPFNPTTTIKFFVASRQFVNLSVYNILGQRVKTLVSTDLDSGPQEVRWDGTDESGAEVSSGIYFYKMSAGDFVDTKKMLLMK